MLDTLALGQRDDGSLAFSNGEDVVEAGSKAVACRVFDKGDVEGAGVSINVLEDSDSSNIVSADAEHMHAIFKLDSGIDFVGLEVEL